MRFVFSAGGGLRRFATAGRAVLNFAGLWVPATEEKGG